MYVLDITISPDDMDMAYDPKKTVISLSVSWQPKFGHVLTSRTSPESNPSCSPLQTTFSTSMGTPCHTIRARPRCLRLGRAALLLAYSAAKRSAGRLSSGPARHFRAQFHVGKTAQQQSTRRRRQAVGLPLLPSQPALRREGGSTGSTKSLQYVYLDNTVPPDPAGHRNRLAAWSVE